MDDPHRSDGSTAATDCDRGSVYDTHTELSVLHHGDTGPGSTLRKLRRRPQVLSKVPSEHGHDLQAEIRRLRPRRDEDAVPMYGMHAGFGRPAFLATRGLGLGLDASRH
jgi:hypothetical protein